MMRAWAQAAALALLLVAGFAVLFGLATADPDRLPNGWPGASGGSVVPAAARPEGAT